MCIVTSCMRHIRSLARQETRGGLAKEMKVYALTNTYLYLLCSPESCLWSQEQSA